MIRRHRFRFHRRVSRGASFAVLAVALALTAPARAALTPSELAQLRDAVSAARGGTTAARMRALVARTDLTDEESAEALAQAFRTVAFTPARAVLLKDVVFGGASVASRPVLAASAVRALVARADSVLGSFGDLPELSPEGAAELLRIYAFINREIANAPGRRGQGREPQNGISLAAYDECARVLARHLDRHPRLKTGTAKSATQVRGQLKLALLDTMNESATFRVEAADRLGLAGARRSFFTELGILPIDSGVAADARIDRVRAVLSRLPSVREGTSAVAFGDPKPDYASRGAVIGITSTLEGGGAAASVSSAARENPFSDEVDPSGTDPAALDLARDLAKVAVQRALDRRGELRLRTERDVRAAAGDPSRLLAKSELRPDAVLAAAVTLLLVDAQRTFDLAFVRFLAGRPESAAILSDALGVLAVQAGSGPEGSGMALALGRTKDDGSTETFWATKVDLGPDGTVRGYTTPRGKWEIVRGESGVVTEVRKNGTPINLAALPTARVPVHAGDEWRGNGLTLVRLNGVPRAGIGAGGRIRVVGTSERGFDAVGAGSPGTDVSASADLKVHGGAGGLFVRAGSGSSGLRGAGVVIEPNPKAGTMRVSLRAVLDTGSGTDIVPSQEMRYATTLRVHVQVRGNKIEASVGDSTVRGTLPPGLATGDVALYAAKDASVEASAFVVRK